MLVGAATLGTVHPGASRKVANRLVLLTMDSARNRGFESRLARLVSIYSIATKGVSMPQEFQFELNDMVRLQIPNFRSSDGEPKKSGEVGVVIGRTQFSESENTYLIRYVAGDGRLKRVWWEESALGHEIIAPSANFKITGFASPNELLKRLKP